MMKTPVQTILRTLLLGVALTLLPGVAIAGHDANLGKSEYLNACAVCHGTSGEGAGSYAGMLTSKPTDLTTLAKKNGGVFPVDDVYQVIDGREISEGHGTRDMPIWGARFSTEAHKHYSDFYGEYNAEALVQTRILSLIDYLNSIQKK